MYIDKFSGKTMHVNRILSEILLKKGRYVELDNQKHYFLHLRSYLKVT